MAPVPSRLLTSGSEIPMLGFGTGTLGVRSKQTEEEVMEVLDTALECGYRHFDTAYAYSNEAAIGRSLKKWTSQGKVKREDLFITTKLSPDHNREADVAMSLQKSLANLGLSYVDLYLVHFPIGITATNNKEEFISVADESNWTLDYETDHVAVWRAMEAQVEAGRTKAIGLSNFNIQQIKRILKVCKVKPAVLQVEANAYFQERPLRTFCQENNIALCAYSPLGSPYKHSGSDQTSVLNDPVVEEVAARLHKTPAQVLLRFLHQLDIIPITKSASRTHQLENIQMLDFQLSAEEMERFTALDKGEAARKFSIHFLPNIENHPEFPF
ncbi:aldo-keto reductase family 1 member A1-like isoform X1 [Homarus americanus]|uniref:aldo-keto reductase family 1 member A1-like isoform X1 n=1 Tax=Homarus americanus TaxID=6706 RepID=UPI001C461A1A|nr:aldo-keto reductase family 1 member A1-like isoform X1 [Homarus americanus]